MKKIARIRQAQKPYTAGSIIVPILPVIQNPVLHINHIFIGQGDRGEHIEDTNFVVTNLEEDNDRSVQP